MKIFKTLRRKPLMIALWIAFVLALAWATVGMASDVFSRHDSAFCYSYEETSPVEKPYMPQAMKSAAEAFLYVLDLRPCGSQDTLNYWLLYNVYSLYILCCSVVLFAPILLCAALICLFKVTKKRVLRDKA